MLIFTNNSDKKTNYLALASSLIEVTAIILMFFADTRYFAAVLGALGFIPLIISLFHIKTSSNNFYIFLTIILFIGLIFVDMMLYF